MPAFGKRSATYCRIAAFSVSTSAVVGAQRRHQAERIDRTEIRAVVLHHLGLRIDFEIVGLGAGFIQRDPGRQRAGERREIKIHGLPPWRLINRCRRQQAGGIDFYTVPHNINRGQGIYCEMVQKSKKPPVAEDRRPRAAQAPRPAARLPARSRARQGARPVPQGWIRGDVARRSLRRHRHEPAEPLRRVRRQARALHQELPALSRGRAGRDGRYFSRRTADPKAAASGSMRWRSTSICPANPVRAAASR